MNNSYLQAMNQIISDRVNQMENTLVYGENLDRGSFISGLSKNLVAGPTRLIKNIGNSDINLFLLEISSVFYLS